MLFNSHLFFIHAFLLLLLFCLEFVLIVNGAASRITGAKLEVTGNWEAANCINGKVKEDVPKSVSVSSDVNLF